MPYIPSASAGGGDEVHALYPPSQSMSLSIEAISGITGSVSIACWLVVFTPQIIENFKRGSAEGLSLTFLILWLLGDIFNVLGAVMQHVLPTMIILAVYYTLADILLLIQCFYYRSVRKDQSEAPLLTQNDGPQEHTANEDSPLLSRSDSGYYEDRIRNLADQAYHLSPANPLHDGSSPEDDVAHQKTYGTNGTSSDAILSLRHTQETTNGSSSNDVTAKNTSSASPSSSSWWKTIYRNTIAVSLVIIAGVFGYYVTPASHHAYDPNAPREPLEWSVLGQVFGYLCAVLYLGSRIPQIVLNYKRKSCEGVAFLFFLFACLGNTTYVISILAYRPGKGENEGYWRYLAVNASWLAGSLGTLFLDFAIFLQFFMYRRYDDDREVESGSVSEEEEEVSDDDLTVRQRSR